MTVVAGAPTASADFAALVAQTAGKPLVRLVASAAQSLATSTLTAITFTGSEDIDTHGFHNPASNTSRITPTIAGYYRLYGVVVFFTTTATLEAYIAKNGTAVAGGQREAAVATGAVRGLTASSILSANGSTDYFEIQGWQNSGGALLTNLSGRITSMFECEFIRPL